MATVTAAILIIPDRFSQLLTWHTLIGLGTAILPSDGTSEG
jgi:hypothetical protein